MSVYIYQPDALDRMTQVEGERWKIHQNGDPNSMCSFHAFYDAWLEWEAYAASEGAYLSEPFSLEVDGNGAIYGEGGWHRYAVRSDGEIIFLAAFCEDPKRHRPLVDAAGFTVWQRWKD